MNSSFVKTKKEIMLIEKACKITDKIFKEIIKNFNFRTEKEIARFIRKKIKENKCRLAFQPIVATSKNASNPHHKATDTRLKGFTVIDLGAKYKDYCSDMSRTIFIGKPKKEDIRLYNLVLSVQRDSIRKTRINLKCNELDVFARKKLRRYKKYFIHSLGHGIGKKIHEKPAIGKKDKYVFQENMVFTVEPGIYLKKRLGIRIEDTLVLTRRGAKRLTHSTKKFLVL